jgi:dipeptidyl aminopeptidase/acylaminoacyl peptidase
MSASSHDDGQLLDQAQLTLDAATLARIAARYPGAHARLEQVELAWITYSSDGLAVKGVLAQPRAPGRYPCLIYNRGGCRDDGAITAEDAAERLARIASWGYVVAASQYRGNACSQGAEQFGGTDVADVLNLIPLLERLPAADSARIGMWGWSRGGMMTYRALARTDRISAAITVSAFTDAFDYVERRPDMEREVFAQLVPRYLENKPAELEARSALHWTGRLYERSPILLLHGGADWRVHPSQALRMAAALYEHKHPFRFVFFEGADHALTEFEEEMLKLCQYWLDRYVRDQQPWPSLEPHGA